MIVVNSTVWIDSYRSDDTDHMMKLRRAIGRNLILPGGIVPIILACAPFRLRAGGRLGFRFKAG